MIDWPALDYTILSQGSVREETDWCNAHLNRWLRMIGEFGSRCNRRRKPGLVSAVRDRRTTEAAARTVQSPQQLVTGAGVSPGWLRICGIIPVPRTS